mmetsp:Transcript_152780/g.266899  ORF Transcript_152780/g.266899 Transcript_152780/m.266899 type:complete len:81 (+) Transcript_152780:649-891(+)
MHPGYIQIMPAYTDLQKICSSFVQNDANLHHSRCKSAAGTRISFQLFPAWCCFGKWKPCKPAPCLPTDFSISTHAGLQVR